MLKGGVIMDVVNAEQAKIAEEAGARVTDFSGAPYTLDKKEILATNCHIHNELKLTLEI